jgi:hypothetical protein
MLRPETAVVALTLLDYACCLSWVWGRWQLAGAHYCAAGLVYKLIEEIGLRLKIPVPAELVILAALATVTEYSTTPGQKQVPGPEGTATLAHGITPRDSGPAGDLRHNLPNEPHLWLRHRPQVEQPGRLATPDLALELLLTENMEAAKDLASKAGRSQPPAAGADRGDRGEAAEEPGHTP